MRQSLRCRGSRGQALAEFAFVVPLLLILIFVIIEFGRFVFAYEVLNNAAREGARYAIVHGSDSACPTGPMPGSTPSPLCDDPSGNAVKDRVVADAITLTLPTSDVNVSWPDLDNARGHLVTVTASYTFTPLIKFQIDFLGVRFSPIPSINMSAESTLVINY